MQKIKGKTMAILIAAILTISMGASILHLPTAKGAPLTVATYAFLNVGPNPIGIGQTEHINMWVDKPTPTANGAYGDRWQNLLVTVIKPDGTTEKLGPFTADDTGGTYTTYTPTQVGNYTFVLNFPGQTIVNANPPPGSSPPASLGEVFAPSTSAPKYLTVQQQPITGYPSTPLPSSYWQTPVFAMNTGWFPLNGNWLGNGMGLRINSVYNASENFNPYTTGPNTAHIMWTKPYAIGGLMGGNLGIPGTNTYTNYYSASQYEPKFAPPIIINGVLYYNSYPGSSTSLEGWVAVDLYTGHTLWVQNYTTTTLRLGQVLNYISPNQYGGLAYLWGSNGNIWSMYDAMTGNWILNIINAPGGIQFVPDPSGDLVAYYVNSTAGTQIIQGAPVTTPKGGAMLECWNASEAIQYPNGYIPGNTSVSWQWRPQQGANITWASGIMWAAPVATNFTEPDGTKVPISPGLSFPTYPDVTGNTIILYSIPTLVGSGQLGWQPGWEIEAGYSLDTGTQTWIINRTEVPATRLSTANGANNGVYTESTLESMSIDAYSSDTGAHLWGPAYENVTGDEWGSYSTSTIMAYDTVFTSDLGGYVYALNATTGALLWTWNTGNGTYATPYNVYPLWYINCVADGKVYVMGGHEYSPPLFSGAQLYCLNATTGQLVWSILDFPNSNGASTAIADGYLVMANAYDNQLYCFGPGPSKLTVNAPNVGVTTSSPITITGTVMDISAGSTQEAIAATYPNGLPAVSDASQTSFMEAVYEQQPMPTNLTGVPIAISVVDSNGNFRTIGTTTSTAYGTYSLTWKPDIPGDYTVIAEFAGTQSYYPSTASIAFYANSPEATSTQTAAPITNAATTTDFMIGVAAIIIVIVIIGAILAMLMIRKRP